MSVVKVRPIIGMEVHVELATRGKVFAHAPNPACAEGVGAGPNTLIDPVVLALPGALPVLNRRAVELSMLVGMALGCEITRRAVWDRKGYFYPDLPKAYQISQYDRPICGAGVWEVPGLGEDGSYDLERATPIRIARAHLEEDAGKLLHEAPGSGGFGDGFAGSILDLNRAGAPLLEIVTEPDFTSAGQCVAFARLLRQTCRMLGATLGVMQAGHMRFEPNINCELTLDDGRVVRTPIVEVKNLNSFRALAGAVEHEVREQPRRFAADGLEMGPGMKATRGWDDGRGVTVVQREKEDAHDYRYFPDPDLPPVEVDAAWEARVREELCELPLARMRRYAGEFGLGSRRAEQLIEERSVCDLLDAAVEAAAGLGVERAEAGKRAADLLLQAGAKLANERGVLVSGLGIAAWQVGTVVKLRANGALSSDGAEAVVRALAEGSHHGEDPESVAAGLGLLLVRDDARLEAWCAAAIAAMPEAAADVRAGKAQAIGRLIGEVKNLSGGSADAKAVREVLGRLLG